MKLKQGILLLLPFLTSQILSPKFELNAEVKMDICEKARLSSAICFRNYEIALSECASPFIWNYDECVGLAIQRHRDCLQHSFQLSLACARSQTESLDDSHPATER